jgi:hypothetical protein
MSYRTTLILLIIVLIIGAYYFFYERGRPSTEELEKKAERIFDFVTDDVTALRITRDATGAAAGAAEIFLVKTEDRWRLEKPLSYKASSSEVDQILSQLETLEFDRMVEGGDPSQLGLENPRLRVKLFLKDNVQIAFAMGSEDAIGQGVFLKRADSETVYVVKKYVFDRLDKETNDFREKKLFDLARWDVTVLEAKGPEQSFRFEQKDGNWFIVSPVHDYGDRKKIESLMDKLIGLQIAEFADDKPEDLSKYGLLPGKEAYRLSLRSGEKTEEVLYLGVRPEADEEKVYGRKEGIIGVFTVPAEPVPLLSDPVSEYRSRQLFPLWGRTVSRLEIHGREKRPVELRERDGAWYYAFPAPKSADVTPAGDVTPTADVTPTTNVTPTREATALKEVPADSDAVREFVRRIREIAIVNFVKERAVDSKNFGLDEPVVRIVLHLTGEAKKRKALVGKNSKRDKCYYARRIESEAIFDVRIPFMEEILNPYPRFCEKDVMRFPVSDATGLRIRWGEKSTALKKAGGKWTIAEALALEKTEIDGKKLDETLRGLSSLKAARIVADVARPGDLKPYGLDAPVVIVSVELDGKEAPGTLMVGKKAVEGGRYARLREKNLVFTLGDDVLGKLRFDFFLKAKGKEKAPEEPKKGPEKPVEKAPKETPEKPTEKAPKEPPVKPENKAPVKPSGKAPPEEPKKGPEKTPGKIPEKAPGAGEG